MEKGDQAASDLLTAVMTARGWDRDQLADHVGKKRRTIDGIMRGELAMAQDLEKHLQLLLDGSAVVKESAPNYDLMKKVIFIEEKGTPEQLALLDSFLDTVCEKLGLPRGRKPDRSGDRSG